MKRFFALVKMVVGLGAVGLLLLFVLALYMAPVTPNGSAAGGEQSHAASAKLPVVAPPITITPSANVDERLFLLRVLNELNTSWPDEDLPSAQLQSALASLRAKATANCGYHCPGTELQVERRAVGAGQQGG